MVHRIIDSVMDGFANGATGLVNGVAGAVKGVGKSVMTGLDKPFTGLTGREGPHRMVDRAADGFINSGTNFIDNGVIGSARTFGKGIMSALDHPLQQLGLDKSKMPEIFKRK